MGKELPDECPDCGHGETAFVKYEPNPNDSQTPFARHSPDIYGLVCMDCGRVHGAITGDPNGREATAGERHRVDEALE